MPRYETDSIILKTFSLAEADRIVVFYTRDHGLLRGVAHGARRLKSKFGSALEPFSEAKLEYFQKEDRELVSIQRAEPIRSSFNIASDPEVLALYSKVAELLLAFVPPSDRNEKIYRMVRACLNSEISDQAGRDSMLLYFSIWILKLGGFLSDWRTCGSCHREFQDAESTWLDQSTRMLCSSCSASKFNSFVSPAHRLLVLRGQRLPPNEFAASCAAQQGISREVSQLIDRSIASAIGKQISLN